MIATIILKMNEILPYFETYVLPFIILWGVLIICHELGHFFIAKLVKVRVEEFSIGYPPKLIGKKWGETDYRISLLPLGGYVKLAGQDDFKGATVSNNPWEYYSKPPWQRLLIIAFGPLANFAIGILLFFMVFLYGKPVTYNPASPGKIGGIVAGSAAARAGLHVGDEILRMGDREIVSWNDLIELSVNPQSDEYTVVIRRNDTVMQKKVIPEKVGARYMLGVSQFQEPVVGSVKYTISDEDEDFKRALLPGDRILSVNGQPVSQWKEFFELVKFSPAGTLRVGVERLGQQREIVVTPGSEEVADIGVLRAGFEFARNGSGFTYTNTITALPPESVLYNQGLRPGDRIIKVNDIKITSRLDFIDAVAGNAEKEIRIIYERAGQKQEVAVVPEKGEMAFGTLPVFPKSYIEKFTPLPAFKKSIKQTYSICAQTLQVMGKVISRKMEAKNVFGGPITIWKITVLAAQTGVVDFLMLMGVISVSLGLINLFPIPVLDGGHIVLCIFEMIRGKMPSERVLNVIHQVGMALLLILMIYIFYIDILRLG